MRQNMGIWSWEQEDQGANAGRRIKDVDTTTNMLDNSVLAAVQIIPARQNRPLHFH